MASAYTSQTFVDLLGESESNSREFKSSRELLGDRNAQIKFIRSLTKEVSAFLNGSGGQLFLGIEEQRGNPNVAQALSEGVPLGAISAKQLEDSLLAQIRPSVANYVHVSGVPIAEREGVRLFAFVIDVAPGSTAYQAADFIYYARRELSAVPMEDRDIRLRMLADEKPRVELLADVMSSDYSYRIRALVERIQALRPDRVRLFEAATDLPQESWLEGSVPNSIFLAALIADPELGKFVGLRREPIHADLRFKCRNVGFLTIKSGYLRIEELRLRAIGIPDGPVEYAFSIPSAKQNTFKTDETVRAPYGTPVSFEKLAGAGGIFPEQEANIFRLNLAIPWLVSADLRLEASVAARLFIDNGLPGILQMDFSQQLESMLLHRVAEGGVVASTG